MCRTPPLEYGCALSLSPLFLSLSSRPPSPPSPSLVYACVHFSQGLRLRQASHSRWMNSRSVLPAVCFLPPKGSSGDSDSKAWSRPRSLFGHSVRAKAIEGSKMESAREIIDLQPGNPNPSRSQPINLNHYATKKSVAESMLDVALFMSNAMRLKTVLEQGPSSQYYATLITLISISLLLQVVIGILLVVIARLNLNEVEMQWKLNQLNNAATILVFITVVVNIFITAFGAHKTGFLAARTSRNPL